MSATRCLVDTSSRYYLVIRITLEQQDIHHGELVRESVPLKLLSHPRTNGRNGQGNVVHFLDLGGLKQQGDTLLAAITGPSFSKLSLYGRASNSTWEERRDVLLGSTLDRLQERGALPLPNSPLRWLLANRKVSEFSKAYSSAF